MFSLGNTAQVADLMDHLVVDSRSRERQGIEDKLGSGIQIILKEGITPSRIIVDN